MGLEQLMDGALCTGVLVEAGADAVAGALGSVRASGEGEEPTAFVAELGGVGWCRVEMTAEVARSARGYDSDPLLAEALSAMNDAPAGGPRGADTPIRTARHLSETLGVAAIGIWASDQGPGIGGAARFDAGRRTWCYSAASPEDVDLIDHIRGAESEETPVAEELEDAFEDLDDRSQERTWSATGMLNGEVSDYVNKALSDLGMDPDWIEEPLWALASGELTDEVTRILWVD